MSLQFIQFKIPCETCIVQSMCQDKQDISDIKLNKNTNKCLGIPDWDMSEKSYTKGLIECWANIGWDIIKQINREKPRGLAIKGEPYSVPTQYIDMLIDIIGTLQWIVNSTSWDKGELHNFDSFELERKLKDVTHWLKNGK